MSGLLGRTPAPAGAGAPAPAAGARAAEREPALAAEAAGRDSLGLRLLAFAALSGFGIAHWALLVENAPGNRMLLVLCIATAGGAALAFLDRAPLPRPAIHALAALTAGLILVLGLMAAGLPGRLLLPEHWAELFDGLDRGLAGVQGLSWPYDGDDEWIRRTVLLGAPALVAIGAALAFWPAREGKRVLRGGGLVALLLLYGAAVAEKDPGMPLLRGLMLLVLVAAWLWLPRLAQREAGVAAAVVVGVGVLTLPVAASLDADRPWWDYRAWEWFGAGKVITFDWNHEYGPLDWSRSGATMMHVKSDRPHYWKAESLDGFDGLRWFRTGDLDEARSGQQLAWSGTGVNFTRWDYGEYNSDWDERIRFTVRSLSTDLVVGAGVVRDVDGIDAVPAADGTTRLQRGARLEEGDSYTISAYAPNPTKEQMENAPQGYASNMVRYTAMQLPLENESATEGVALQGDAAREAAAALRQTIFFPLRDEPVNTVTEEAEPAVRNSPYARMYAEAQRLTADAPSAYAAVKNVERYLQESFSYAERVPTRPIPLTGFLYEDERGYCQQFSGAMALMLRMSGIPAQVAAGFSPGSYNKDTREYRVRDLDAHSWVEVWFTGIGWVPFDPTPARSPAASQSSALATSAAAADAGEANQTRLGVAGERGTDTGAALRSEGDGGGSLVPVLLILLVAGPLAVGTVLVAVRVRRVRELGPAEVADAQLSELRRALVRLGWDVPASTTLLALERRLGRFAGPASEAYAGALRANRYDPRSPSAPSLRDRRALRRELSRGRLRDRLRGLLAIPPRAPRL